MRENMNISKWNHQFFLVLACTLLIAPYQSIAATTCGPGNHWIDTCGAGVYTVPIVMEFGIDTNFDVTPEFNAQFVGNATITYSNPVDAPDPLDPGHLNRINTEILSMDLAGTGPVSGWRFRAGSSQNLAASIGSITEEGGYPDYGDSYYYLFFQIDGTPYGSLHNDPNKSFWFYNFVTGIPEVGSDFKHLGGPFNFTAYPLYDTTGTSAVLMTNLSDGGRPHFLVTPLPGSFLLMASAFGVFGMISRKKRGRDSNSFLSGRRNF